MSLSDYVPAKRPVEYQGKVLINVRGLSLQDVTVLMRNHTADLRALYDMFDPDARKLLPNASDVDSMIFSLMANFPGTAATMIALAADEPNGEAYAAKLPAPLQLKIISEVVKQTFEDVGGPLAFAAMLRTMISPAAVVDSTTIQ